MSTIRDQAVVLGHLDFSESSQVVVLFTRDHGKVRAIAKGIRRGTKTRFATGMDLLDIGDVVASVRQERSATLVPVTEWRQRRSQFGLRDRLSRIRGGEYAAEITTHLTEDWDPHPAVFDALVGALEDLAGAEHVLPVVVLFQTALLHDIGLLPRFDACVLCERGSDLTHFSSFEGGMVCRHCEPTQVEKREVSAPTLARLHELTSSSKRQVAEGDAGRADGPFALLDYHIAHLMGRPPRLSAQLMPLLARRRVQ